MVKKITGMTLLAALLIAPFALMTRNADAVPTGEVCYFGKIGHRFGVVVEVDPEVADLAVRARVASYDFEFLKRTYRGYELCVRSRRMD